MEGAIDGEVMLHLLYGAVVADAGIQDFEAPVAGGVQLPLQNFWRGAV